MTIATVITRGFGNGTFNGTIPFIVTAGYNIGEEVLTEDSTFAVFGVIQERGLSVASTINTNGVSVLVDMTGTFATFSTIQETGKSVTGLINENGQSVRGDI